MFLLDTNVASELSKSRPSLKVTDWFKTVPRELQSLSVISIAEIIRGIEGDRDVIRQRSLRKWLDDDFRIWLGPRLVPLNETIAKTAGKLAAERALLGRPISFQDACIAATAISFGLILVTRNVRDFEYLPLEIFDPWNDPIRETFKP